jgi:hypothetical protein
MDLFPELDWQGKVRLKREIPGKVMKRMEIKILDVL